ncbi:uncharacterized protein DEA37_0002635 [Paragonimus westermani]|uniref:Uncharacterized protein n=1 Tax=Paragonimus westermani TaxID=34504 RepID=A0A5J4NGF1_9TREM|nr:uncharacterized protein DEA37_0002635 [Paragonimus westermani]
MTLAKCGILFYKKPVPADIMFAFYYQLDNLFAMSKVIHTMRSITDWLDATENRAFQVLSVYEMHTQIPNFVDTLADHLKALKICGQLLQHLGSICHRVKPYGHQHKLMARAVIDYQATVSSFPLRANQSYSVRSNKNPHIWKLDPNHQPIPSLFLEASTEFGEQKMLKRLQNRFNEFLIMCHGRSRRQLYSRLSKQLEKNKKCATLPTMQASRNSPLSLSALDGLYFARSPFPTKRWRSLYNAKVLYRQPTTLSCTASEDVTAPDTIRRMMIRLRQWLYQLPSPALLMNSPTELQQSTKKNLFLADGTDGDGDVVEDVYRWWSIAGFFVVNPMEIDRIVHEACFLKNLNDILQITVDISMERTTIEKNSRKHTLPNDQTKSHRSQFTRVLIEELMSRLGEPFYHPRSGRFSYRWVQKSVDRSHSPSSPSITGTCLFSRSTETRSLSSSPHF